MKKTALFLATLIVLLTSVACQNGGEPENSADTVSAADTEDVGATELEYDVSGIDYDGYVFRTMNADEMWGFKIRFDVAETTGEALNDAIYDRNRLVEDVLNITITESQFLSDDLLSKASASVMANTDEYDVMYLRLDTIAPMVTGKSLVNLADLKELQLDQSWWDAQFNDNALLDGKRYFAVGDAHLMAHDGTWCIFFNENMMDDLNLTYPYQLVRDGKWTLDKMYEYCAAVANLGGDESFAWDMNGNAMYGLSSFENYYQHMAFALGTEYIKNNNGIPEINFDKESFIETMIKVDEFINTEGVYYKGNASNEYVAETGGFCAAFSTGRALFMAGEIKIAQGLRDMEDTFGIVPQPKLNEEAEYRTSLLKQLLVMTIPVTNSDYNRTAQIMDYISFESSQSVVPVFFGSTVEHKGLRNEDSIEMLELIRSTRSFDMGMAWNWVNDLNGQILADITNNSLNISSTVASLQSSVQASIDKMMDELDT